MATITSVGSGNWGTAGTWDAGVPADGDAVVIAAGHTVTFNVDQSAFTTGIGLTITGTLTHTTTTGVYVLKAKTGASIVGAGTWNIGTSGAPIPFATKHTITGAAGWYVDGNAGLTMTVYGAEPSIKYVKLSGDEAIGQTELSVDTNVTGDIWAVGDIVRIDDINRAQETEERVIAAGGIAAGAITVTAGLTAAKSTGAYVLLSTRNVKIIAVGTGTRTIYRVGATANKLTIQSGMWYGVNKYMLDTCHYATISGGTLSGNTYGLNNCNSATISGGTFSGNGRGLYACDSATISGATFTSNDYDLYTVQGVLHNEALTSATEHLTYTDISAIYQNCQSFDHDGSDGALKAWCKGGVITSQATTVPSGHTQAYTHALESAIYPAFWYKNFTVPVGKTYEVEVQLRKSASMTYLPRVYLVKSIENPLAGATPVDSFTMTDSTDTWETDTFTVTNATGYDQDYTLWFVAQNATGTAISAVKITPQETGGVGAVSIQPIQGSVRL